MQISDEYSDRFLISFFPLLNGNVIFYFSPAGDHAFNVGEYPAAVVVIYTWIIKKSNAANARTRCIMAIDPRERKYSPHRSHEL